MNSKYKNTILQGLVPETPVMLSFEDIEMSLPEKGLYKIAEESGVSYPVLRSLKDRKKTNFRTEVLIKLSRYLIENHLVPLRHDCGNLSELRIENKKSTSTLWYCIDCKKYFGSAESIIEFKKIIGEI